MITKNHYCESDQTSGKTTENSLKMHQTRTNQLIADKKDLRHDRKDIRGDKKDIAGDTKDIRNDKQDLHHDYVKRKRHTL